MDVTRDNFVRALAEFKAGLGPCSFAALDMEMTGLYESRQWQPSRSDSLDDRYAKLKRSVEAYGVIQVGICLFTWIDEGHGAGYYEARPFNFNVFPASSAGGAPVDVNFACSGSAMEFLAKNTFDFNKWAYQGIPFLDSATAARVRAERTQLLTSRQRTATPDDRSCAFARDLESALTDFLQRPDATSMRYNTENSYERRLVYDAVSAHKNLGARSRTGYIEVFKGSPAAVERHTAQKLKTLNASINEAYGFAAVIELLSASRKPVVGHNMPLDVIHAYSKFVRPLPPTRAELEHALAELFPMLIDTKHIIESTPAIKTRYGSSALDEIAPALEREAGSRASVNGLVRFHPRFSRNIAHSMHEAGYDAYMTGATFVRLLNLGGSDLNLSAAPGPDLPNSELVLYRYINRLHMVTTEGTHWRIC